MIYNNNNNNIAFFSQASWGRLEMKPERNRRKPMYVEKLENSLNGNGYATGYSST